MTDGMTRVIGRTGMATLGLAAMLMISLPAAARPDGEQARPVVKYRQNVMHMMASIMGTTVGQLRDGIEHGPDLDVLARALESASSDLPALFPEGSGVGKTEALPVVWEKPDEFGQHAKTLHAKAEAFSKAVESGDRMKTFKAFKAVGDACKACHQDFRESDH